MKFQNVLGALIAVGAFGLWAAASPIQVNITFVSSYSALGGPTQGAFYYPYVITVNGNTLNVACDDFNDQIYIHNPGETWTATENTFNASGVISGGLYIGQSNANTKYQEAAWLFHQFQPVPNPPGQNNVNAAINFAMWDLFDPSAPALNPASSCSSATNTSSTYWLCQAASEAAGGFSGFDFSNYIVFTPVPNSWNSNLYPNAPQELIGAVPEPATWALMLTGLLGLAGLAWRRRDELGGIQS